MGYLKYKSIIPNNKPRWLLDIQEWVNKQYAELSLKNEMCEFEALQYFINTAIKELKTKKLISRSTVETEIRTDENKTVLFIKRNEKVIQTYYIE